MTSNASKPEFSDLLTALCGADAFVLLECLERDIGLTTEPKAQYPAWVVRCGTRAARALFPVAYRLCNDPKRRAYTLGVCVGMMRAGEISLASAVAPFGTPVPSVSDEQCGKIWQLLYQSDAASVSPRDDSALLPLELPQWLAEVEADFGLRDSAEYHQGAADAVRMLTGSNDATEATSIYLFMAIYWRVVEQLHTADCLYELLIRILGRNVIGSDPKRVAQICGRVGKVFRPPGRPRKTTSTCTSR